MNKLFNRASIALFGLSLMFFAGVLDRTQAKKQTGTQSNQSTRTSQQANPSGYGPQDFKLPANNVISHPYNEMRFYHRLPGNKAGRHKKIVAPYDIPNATELKQIHGAIDMTSNDAKGKATPLEFVTPVEGKVEIVSGSAYNTIKIKTHNGEEMRFLHSSEIKVKNGDWVTPGTVIGKTGGYGPVNGEPNSNAYDVHLHYETRDARGVKYDPGEWKPEYETSMKNRAATMKTIEDSMIAKGSLKSKSGQSQAGLAQSGSTSKPGGVIFNKEVSMLSDLSDIQGAFFDNQAGRIVFIGESNVDAPVMDKNLLAVALRAVYSGEFPGVSIDPSSEPSSMKVRYLGKTENTRFGAIMFEADRVLKALSRGEDNLSKLPVRSSVSGYQSISKRQVNEVDRAEGRSLYRLWFKPNKLTMKKTTDGASIAFVESTMICDWENMQGINPGSAVQSFVNHLNNNLLSYADDQPILHDMLFLEKVVGLALWMRDQGIFLDPNLLGIEGFETPATTPATTITSTIRTAQSIWTLTSTGGVDLSISNPYVPDTDRSTAQMKDVALRSRPRADMVSWDFKLNDKYLTAVALPVSYRPTRRAPIAGRVNLAAPGQPTIADFQIDQSDDSSTMTISGVNFGVRDSSSKVTVNGTPVSIKLWSNTKIIVVLPQEDVASYSVTVTRRSAQSPPLLLQTAPDPVAIIRKVRSSQYSNLPPLVGNNGGRGEESGITIQNNTPYALRVYIAGPVVQWFNLSSGQSTTLNLRVGNYEAAIKATGGNVMPLYSTWQISPNTRYTMRLSLR